ncbi:MAG: AAA family ATPase, partial [Usitatibacter sp.]
DLLHDCACYPHPAGTVQMIETHISWVLLAGDFAYKVKKPVSLPFLDFSTLEARRRACEEEVRLNRRTAPQLYLGVVPIGGALAAPRVAEGRQVFEYAVKMLRFPQEALYSERAKRGILDDADIDALAEAVVALHRQAPRGGAAQPMPEGAIANLAEIAALCPAPARACLEVLEGWTRREAAALAGTFERRAGEGFVRECHGDLHLANVVRIDGRPVAFDCIEFSAPLRNIDVMSEVAFTTMDLQRHGLPRKASRFLNCYLESTGDYAGLAVLRFYQVYRAAVRAKVAMLGGATEEACALLGLAEELTHREAPVVVLMHGVSGSGKSTAAARLLEALGAIRLRSDVERKRLHGIGSGAHAPAAAGAGMYGPRENAGTYERLEELASGVIAAGYPVIVDATFLHRADRDRFRAVAAREHGVLEIADCHAPEAILRRRVAERERGGDDASDAGVEVLQAQLGMREPLGADERMHSVYLDTSRIEWKVTAESLARRFRAHPIQPGEHPADRAPGRTAQADPLESGR